MAQMVGFLMKMLDNELSWGYVLCNRPREVRMRTCEKVVSNPEDNLESFTWKRNNSRTILN